jgi:hypothetical protein
VKKSDTSNTKINGKKITFFNGILKINILAR